jgi:hypothetical protein
VDDSQKTTMRQKLANLRPQASFFSFSWLMKSLIVFCFFSEIVQGTVYYPNPRLHVDFPIPMYSPIEK